MTPSEFAAKWKGVQTTERAASQSHFLDLCRMLGVGAPTDMDPTGESYAFEKGAEKVGGGDDFADVWKKNHFAWEARGGAPGARSMRSTPNQPPPGRCGASGLHGVP